MLLDMLQVRMNASWFNFKGQCFPLFDSGLDQTIREISTKGLNDVLIPA